MAWDFIAQNAGDYAGALLPPVQTLADAMATISGLVGAFRAPSGALGGEVTNWGPAAGTYSMTGAAGVDRPVFSTADDLPTLRFQGGDDFTFTPTGSIDLATEITFGIRAKFQAIGATQIIAGDASNRFRIDATNGNTVRFFTASSSNAYVTAPISLLGWHTIICTHSNGISRIDIDGVVIQGPGAALNAGVSAVLGAWAAGIAMDADVRNVFLAASDTYGLPQYDVVKSFLG